MLPTVDLRAKTFPTRALAIEGRKPFEFYPGLSACDVGIVARGLVSPPHPGH